MIYIVLILIIAVGVLSFMLSKAKKENAIQKTETTDATLKERQNNLQEDVNQQKEELKEIKEEKAPELKPDEVEDFWSKRK